MIIRISLGARFSFIIVTDFLLTYFSPVSLKFLFSSSSLAFESSFSFKLNNSFGRPPYTFFNKIVGTIFVRSSFPIPSFRHFSLSIYLFTVSLSTLRLFDLSNLELLRLAVTVNSRLVKARLIYSSPKSIRKQTRKRIFFLHVGSNREIIVMLFRE